MGLVELIRGMQTSDETFEATQLLAMHLGKTTCVSLVGWGGGGWGGEGWVSSLGRCRHVPWRSH